MLNVSKGPDSNAIVIVSCIYAQRSAEPATSDGLLLGSTWPRGKLNDSAWSSAALFEYAGMSPGISFPYRLACNQLTS